MLSPSLTPAQCETIHRSALRVLDEYGIKIEHDGLAKRLETVGGRIDGGRVRFPTAATRAFLDTAERTPMTPAQPTARGHVGIYACQFLDPESGALRGFDEPTLARYLEFARSFPDIRHIGILGLPFVPPEVPGNPQPLLEKLFSWKYGAVPDGSVQDTHFCEPLLAMFRCRAAGAGRPLEEVFTACGYLVSPLRLARPECEQLLWFAERGLRMGIGSMPSVAGTAPVTVAGAATLMLAEQVFLALLRKAMFGEAHLALGAGCCAVDMRRGYPRFGRPELFRVTAAMASMARFYGCTCHGHSGLSDAKVPSAEAGAQKMMGLMATAMATGAADVSAGLLSTDEIHSPIQLVLDMDMVGALNALFAGIEVTEETCAVEEILAVGAEGSHIGTVFTAERFRSELWMPATWSGELLGSWLNVGRRTDVDAARDRWRRAASGDPPRPRISEEEERELRGIISTCAGRP